METQIRYKLTRKNQTTYGGFKWRKRRWYKTSGEGYLCGPGWLHCYTDPLLAILLNPIHANIPEHDLLLWKCGVRGLRERIKELERDKDRLDWLLELAICYEHTFEPRDGININSREIIDALMEKRDE